MAKKLPFQSQLLRTQVVSVEELRIVSAAWMRAFKVPSSRPRLSGVRGLLVCEFLTSTMTVDWGCF